MPIMMEIYEIRFKYRTWDGMESSGKVSIYDKSIRTVKNYAKRLERDGHWDVTIWKTSVKFGFGDGTEAEAYTQVN